MLLDTIILFRSSQQSCSQGKYQQSYVCGPGNTPLLGMTIGQLLDKTVEKHGDNEAVVVVHQNVRKTYQELRADVCRNSVYA